MIKFLVSNCGMYESQDIAGRMWRLRDPDKKIETPEEAAKLLAKDIKAKFDELKSRYHECCQKFLDQNFCAECGKRIQDSDMQTAQWICDIHKQELHEDHFDEYFSDENTTWITMYDVAEMLGSSPDEVVQITNVQYVHFSHFALSNTDFKSHVVECYDEPLED